MEDNDATTSQLPKSRSRRPSRDARSVDGGSKVRLGSGACRPRQPSCAINGCAFCLDMHSKDLRARGEAEQRIYMLSAWREVPNLYSARERAALAWAEAITRLTNHDVSDELYNEARGEFSEKELAQLTLSIVAINGWNRLNVAFRTPAGNYKSAIKQSAA